MVWWNEDEIEKTGGIAGYADLLAAEEFGFAADEDFQAAAELLSFIAGEGLFDAEDVVDVLGLVPL